MVISGQTYCAEYAIDYYCSGTDVGSSITGHWQECASRCSSNSNCNYWTWNLQNNYCYLKRSNCGRRSVDHAISGSKTCTDEC